MTCLDELRRAGQEVALGVEHHRRAVEDELVLAADLVHVHERARRVGRPGWPASARARRACRRSTATR